MVFPVCGSRTVLSTSSINGASAGTAADEKFPPDAELSMFK